MSWEMPCSTRWDFMWWTATKTQEAQFRTKSHYNVSWKDTVLGHLMIRFQEIKNLCWWTYLYKLEREKDLRAHRHTSIVEKRMVRKPRHASIYDSFPFTWPTNTARFNSWSFMHEWQFLIHGPQYRHEHLVINRGQWWSSSSKKPVYNN